MSRLTLKEVKESLICFANQMYDIPIDFIVHDDYINDISKEEFIIAFKEYRGIIHKYYINASEDMINYGYSSISRKTQKETLSTPFVYKMNNQVKEAQVIMFLYRLCTCSTLNENMLTVDINEFKEAINVNGKLHKPNMIIKNLTKLGFVFDGYNKTLKKTDTLCVTYPNHPNVITVVKNYCECKHAFNGSGIDGMIFDFAHCNYKILSIAKDKLLPNEDLFIMSLLNNRSKEFLLRFNEELGNNGYFYGDGPMSAHCWGYWQLAYARHPESKTNYVCRIYGNNDTFTIRLYLKNIDKYSDYIENSPMFIRTSFIDEHGKCRGCKNKCNARKTYTIDGKKYSKCQGEMLYFNCIEDKTIPYYIKLIKLSQNS